MAAHNLLNDGAAHVLHANALALGEQHVLEGGPVIEVVELTEPTAHLSLLLSSTGGGYARSS